MKNLQWLKQPIQYERFKVICKNDSVWTNMPTFRKESLVKSKTITIANNILELGYKILKYLRNNEGNVIIILSCHQHEYSWPYVATPPYRSSLPAGPQGYTLYTHRAAVCGCKLVAQTFLGHVKGSIGVHHLWARPYFSSSALDVWLV